MKKLFKRKFALTDKGAEDLAKASLASFFTYIVNMLPAILLMLLFDELVLGHKKTGTFYIIFSVFALVLMYVLFRI